MGGGDAPSPPPYLFGKAAIALAVHRSDTCRMIWMALGAATLAFSAAAQAAAPADGHFTVAELRMLCRGEAEGNPQFRTQAGYAMLAEYQRAKCRMYLLGLADGIGWQQADGRACASPATAREALGDRLVEAVLEAPATSGSSIRAIVAATLILHPPCR